MNRKKMMPLLLLAAGVVVLAVLLVLLQWSQSRGQQAEIPLCDFSVDAIDQVSYRDDSVEETLIRQGDGDWVLQDDPTLPLDQEVTGSLIEKFASSHRNASASARGTGRDPGAQRYTADGVFHHQRGKYTHPHGGSGQRCGGYLLRL